MCIILKKIGFYALRAVGWASRIPLIMRFFSAKLAKIRTHLPLLPDPPPPPPQRAGKLRICHPERRIIPAYGITCCWTIPIIIHFHSLWGKHIVFPAPVYRVRVCVRACVRARVRACACVRACTPCHWLTKGIEVASESFKFPSG